MFRRKFKALVVFAMTSGVINTLAIIGQEPIPGGGPTPIQRVPSWASRQLMALGDRMSLAGKERTIYTGEVTDATGAKLPAQVTYQLPGSVRIEGFKPGQVLSFDGKNAVGAISLDDDLLLETFVMDFPEGMLLSLRLSAATRILGWGFGPDPRSTTRYTGPRYDVIEVTGQVRTHKEELIRLRLYYFDSQTGLLHSTRYVDESRSIKVETRFSQWGSWNGAAYPGRIEHYENGQLVFSFTALSITAAPPLQPGAFQ